MIKFKCPKCEADNQIPYGEAKICRDCGYNLVINSLSPKELRGLVKGESFKLNGSIYVTMKVMSGGRYMIKRMKG